MPPIMSPQEARSTITKALRLDEAQSSAEDYVLVSIDVEWGAFLPKDHPCHGKLTEIGICKLDTRELERNAPGDNVSEWLSKAHAKHYRMADTVGIESDEVDKRGVRLWAAENFEFGISTIIAREDVAEAVKNDLCVLDDRGDDGTNPIYRKVILVAQGWGNESTWLRDAVGLDIDSLGTVVAIADTQAMYANEKDRRPGLETLMRGLGMIPRHMHNGANDAVYTLAVLVVAEVWRSALELTRKGKWESMNKCFPLMKINGETAIEALKKEVYKETGGWCTRCNRSGHIVADCDQQAEYPQQVHPGEAGGASGEAGNQWVETAEAVLERVGEPLLVKLRTTSDTVTEQ